MVSGICQMTKKDPSTIIRNKSSNKTFYSRKDFRGILIQKGNKAHKISFIDQISKVKLIEDILIENFKSYNADMSFGNENCTCKCIIF